MWMDGILTDRGKRSKAKRSRAKPRRRQQTVKVSARTRERNAERRKRTALVLLCLAVLVGFGWVGHRSFKLLSAYLFTENDRYVVQVWDFSTDGPVLTPAHIRQYAGLRERENLLALDLREIRYNLESTPAIQSVQVSRRLPDTLVIRVQERMALARLDQVGSVPLAVDADGYVLGPSSLRPNLPVIRGIREPGIRPGMRLSEPYFKDALTVLTLCNRSPIHPHVRLREIDVRHDENLTLRLETGEEVRMARAHLEPRLAELVEILQEQRRRGRMAAVVNMTGHAHIPPVVTHQ